MALQKNVFTGFLVLAMLVGSFGLTGCFQQDADNVSVTVPNVSEVAATAEAFSALARVTYIGNENSLAVKEVLDNIIDVVKKSDHNISNLILETAKTAIDNGQMSEAYLPFFSGLLGVIDVYFKFRPFNVDDIVKICEAASRGLDPGGVSAQSVILTW